MRRTLNEVYRICQKAAEGVGVPAGLDIDAAQNAAWLVAHGFAVLDGLAAQLERVTGGDACGFGADESVAETLDATGKPGALLATALVDLLIARAEGQAGRLAVTGLSAPLYLLPAAVRYARDGWGFRFELSSPARGRFVLCVDPAGTSILGPAGTGTSALTDDAGFDLIANCAPAPGALPAQAPQLAVLASSDTLAEAHARSLAQGSEIGSDLWDRLQAYAVRVLVPATEESRLRGAGSKSNDNE